VNDRLPSAASPRRISLLLWTINVCAICASTLSYVYLSYTTYKSTGSVFLSQVVLFSPMVLPVVLVGQIHRIAERISPRALLQWANGLSLSACAVVYPLLADMPLSALAGGVLVGTLDAVQRVARIVAIKRYFNSGDVKFTVPLTLTAQFIAGGLAGAAIGVVRGEMTPLIALAMTSTLFVAAASAASLLPAVRMLSSSAAGRALWPTFSALLRSNGELRRSFWVFVVFVGVYQGFFNVSRVTLPAHVLHLSDGYVGLLQSVNSVAALVGAIVYYTLGKRGWRFPPLAMAGISGMFMLGAASGTGVAPSYLAYFVYIFFFELVFFRLQADVVVHSPPQDMPLVASVQCAGVYLAMISAIFVGSLLVEQVGLLWTGVLFLFTYALALLLRPDTFRPAAEPV
jgi:hypothetical protein